VWWVPFTENTSSRKVVRGANKPWKGGVGKKINLGGIRKLDRTISNYGVAHGEIQGNLDDQERGIRKKMVKGTRLKRNHGRNGRKAT